MDRAAGLVAFVLVTLCVSAMGSRFYYPTFCDTTGLSFSSSESFSHLPYKDRLKMVLMPKDPTLTVANAMWQQSRIDLSATGGIRTAFAYQFGWENVAATPTNGIALVFMEPVATPPVPSNVGSGIGYEGLEKALVIELDTVHDFIRGDPNGNHVSIHTSGAGTVSANEHPPAGVVCNGTWYNENIPPLNFPETEIVVEFFPMNQLLIFIIPGTGGGNPSKPALNCTVDWQVAIGSATATPTISMGFTSASQPTSESLALSVWSVDTRTAADDCFAGFTGSDCAATSTTTCPTGIVNECQICMESEACCQYCPTMRTCQATTPDADRCCGTTSPFDFLSTCVTAYQDCSSVPPPQGPHTPKKTYSEGGRAAGGVFAALIVIGIGGAMFLYSRRRGGSGVGGL